MRFIYLILTIVAIVGCKTDKSEVPVFVLQQQLTQPKENLQFDRESYGRQADFAPLYIGTPKDTLFYNSISEDSYYGYLTDHYNCTLNHEDCPLVGFDSLSVYVDTSQIVNYYGLLLLEPVHPDSIEYENEEERAIKEAAKLYSPNGYPIIVSNTSQRHQVIGTFNRLLLYIEVFEEGKWKELQYPVDGCGHSSSLLLPPNEICITSFPLFENLKGKRLRLILNYHAVSNEFGIQ